MRNHPIYNTGRVKINATCGRCRQEANAVLMVDPAQLPREYTWECENCGLANAILIETSDVSRSEN